MLACGFASKTVIVWFSPDDNVHYAIVPFHHSLMPTGMDLQTLEYTVSLVKYIIANHEGLLGVMVVVSIRYILVAEWIVLNDSPGVGTNFL